MRTGTVATAAAVSLVGLATTGVRAGVVVRVRKTAGGPQITVNGTPVRPWMFFGHPSAGSIRADKEWKKVTFSFTPGMEAAGRGTLHFRFGHHPGDVWIRRIRIVEEQTERDVLPAGTFAAQKAFNAHWDVWPPDDRNTVGKVAVENGVLHVRLTSPPKGRPWPDFHIPAKTKLTFHRNRTYTVSFEVRADPPRRITVSTYFVTGGRWLRLATAEDRGEDSVFLRQVAMARDAGVRFITFVFPHYWAKPDERQYWQGLDSACRSIIRVHPKALLIPRVGMSPPGWWYAAHPEARMVFDDGKSLDSPSVSSRAYRRTAAAWLETLCRHLMETFPDHFAGVHPCGQNTGEWFYDRSWRRPLSGYDAATRSAWRAWLKERGFPNAAEAEVPSAEARRSAPNGLLRDPAQPQERLLIEFARFRQQEMADTVLALAAAARKATRGEKLVVFFYGYFFEFAAMISGAHESGHYALDRLLDSPDIDVLCSPISYFDRQWLGTGPCMSPAESVTAVGKLWLNEDDTRTHLARTTRYGGVRNIHESRAVLTRNLGQESLRGFGTWWMDLPGKGWFDDARLWEVMKRLTPLGDAMLRRRTPYTPDVALIVGQDSMCCLAFGANAATRPLVYESRAAFGRAGTPYGQYMLRDAVAGRIPARLQVFLAAWSLTPNERRALRTTIPPGAARVWCWAPGWIDPKGCSTDAMQELTGFRCTPVDQPAAQVRATRLGIELGFPETWGVPKKIRPLFTAEAPGARVLAVWPDGKPAVLVRNRSDNTGAEVFYGVPAFNPAAARALVRLAGLTPAADADVSAWRAEHCWLLYPFVDGRQQVRLENETGPVRDPMEERTFGAAPVLEMNFEAGAPVLLRCGSRASD